MPRAVFLDRDGVLNRAIVRHGRPYAPRSMEQMVIEPEALLALERLRQQGFLLVVVTNQPEVARGTLTRASLDAMHLHLSRTLPLDEIRVCDHDDSSGCSCRKPKPGLIVGAATDLGINLSASFVVGDRWRDIDAGAAAGCRTVWIDAGYDERGPSLPPSARVMNLEEATRWILAQS